MDCNAASHTVTGNKETTTNSTVPKEVIDDVKLWILIRYDMDENEKYTRQIDRFYLLKEHRDLLLVAAKELNWPVSTVDRYSGSVGLQYFYHQLCILILDRNISKFFDDALRRAGELLVFLASDGEVSAGPLLQIQSSLLFPDALGMQHVQFDRPHHARRKDFTPGELPILLFRTILTGSSHARHVSNRNLYLYTPPDAPRRSHRCCNGKDTFKLSDETESPVSLATTACQQI